MMCCTESKARCTSVLVMHGEEHPAHDLYQQQKPGEKAEAPPIAQIARSGILGKLTPNERGERKTPVYPCDHRFQRGHALTHDDLVGAGKVVRRHVEIARRRSVQYPAAVVVGAAMAGTQPDLLTLVGHASQMSADAHHHQPLGLL